MFLWNKQSKIAMCLSLLFIRISFAQDIAYVINAGSSIIGIYTVGANGALINTGKTINTNNDPEDWGLYNNGNNLYTLSWTENTLSLFQVNQSTGELTPLLSSNDTNTNLQPWLLAITPDGKCGYSGGYADNTIGVYKIQSDGKIVLVDKFAPNGLAKISGTRVDPNNEYLLALSQGTNQIASFNIDKTSCEITNTGFIVNTSSQPSRLKIIKLDNGKQFVYVVCSGSNKVSQYELNANGSFTSFGDINTMGIDPMNVFFFNKVNLYLPNRASNNIAWFKIGNDGTLTFQKLFETGGVGSRNIVFNKDGSKIYVANQFSDDISLLNVNPDGSLSAPIDKYNAANQPYGLSLFSNEIK